MSSSVLKYSIIILEIFIMICGMAIVAIGAFGLTHIDLKDILELRPVMFIMVFVGCTIILFSFTGSCVVIFEDPLFITSWSVMTMTQAILILAGGAFILAPFDDGLHKLNQEVAKLFERIQEDEEFLVNAPANKNDLVFVALIQSELKCCQWNTSPFVKNPKNLDSCKCDNKVEIDCSNGHYVKTCSQAFEEIYDSIFSFGKVCLCLCILMFITSLCALKVGYKVKDKMIDVNV